MSKVDVVDGSVVSMVDPYWFHLVWRFNSSVDSVTRGWILVSIGRAAMGSMGTVRGKDAVATIPWIGSGFWSTMGGGLGDARLG